MKTLTIRAVLVAAATLLAGQAQAVVVIDTCKLLGATDSSGIEVRECSTFLDYYKNYYQLNNPTATPIFGLFVSTQARAWERTIVSTRDGWNAEYLSEDTWNERYEGAFGQSFDNLFGTDDSGVFYMLTNSEEAGIALTDGAVMLARFNALPVSNFVALGTGNTVVAQSFAPTATAVPEPAGFGLAALGLLAAAATRRRRA